jgi:hypothetical protein
VTELITRAVPSKPAATAFTHSFLGLNSISADGRFIVTLRYDDPSAFRDTNGYQDVFISDVINGKSVIASISTNVYVTNSDGGAGPSVTFIDNTNSYLTPIISADGSMVYATLRTPNGNTRVYGASTAEAMGGGGLKLSSLAPYGNAQGSHSPSCSSNGVLVFTSTSTGLVEPGIDNNSAADVFLRHTMVLSNGLLQTSNELISVSLSGHSGNQESTNGMITPDSRWVVFESAAGNLTTNNTAGLLSLFARDLRSNVTYVVSIAPNGNPQLGYVPGGVSISGNSRYVAFVSVNLELFVHDLFTHTSVSAGISAAAAPSMSRDSRVVACIKQTFSSSPDQIYARDLQSPPSELVSVSRLGRTANGSSSSPLVSADGRYVVFQSKASDLVANDTNGMTDGFVRDRLLGVTMLVSANGQGLPGNGPSSRPVMAADGRTVAFQSFANDLVSRDFNDKRDIFVLKLGGADTDGDGLDDDWEVAYFGNLSRNGSGDFDSDGQTDLQEFLAGTDPTNSNSVFRVLTVTPVGGGSTQVIWTGNPSRTYRVEFKDDVGATNWTTVAGTLSWNGSAASIADTSATNSGHRYYRAVRLP